jgi:periplasmic divalent cation tolerance protein
MKYSFGYLTFKNNKEAQKICKALVKEKLIACANIFSPHATIYNWQGKVVSGKEVAAIVKTRKSLEKKVTALVQKNHSYKTPCIVFLPLTTASKDFADWLKEETKL